MRESASRLGAMRSMATSVRSRSKVPPRWILGGVVFALAIGLYAARRHATLEEDSALLPSPTQVVATTGPPWIYGPPEARFSIIGYADLECPYCRDYFPVLQQWIQANSDVNWQWHHLPLPTHEPKATFAARLAECAGNIGGNAAFWNAVAWLYEHDSRDVAGVIEHTGLSKERTAFEACVDTARPDAYIQHQAITASRDGVHATPTLRMVDRRTGRAVMLPGPADGDALLSAIDLVLTPADAEIAPAPKRSEFSADAIARQRHAR